ncbi:MAG: CDGSH iron-sulfur domain-containing protein [Magnetococcales bacterium]|nr:CDGSH iron-sulfur domain-containing protein [Magnetococcales bacterium]
MWHRNHPFMIHLPAGQHAICSCGESLEPPLCDKSGGRSCKSQTLTLDTPRMVAVCACGKSKTMPTCDGSHGYDHKNKPRRKQSL